jgi:hypothetical protein
MDTHRTDQDRLVRCLAEVEVVAIRFQTIGQRLLVDSRTTDLDGPMIKVVEPAANVQERMRSLKKLRPRFKLPRKIAAVWWPGYVRSIEESGTADAIVRHMAAVGGMPAARAARDALDELLLLERHEIYKAIRGIDYKTLWEPS